MRFGVGLGVLGGSMGFCCPYGCYMTCEQATVVKPCLLVSGGLLSKGHLLWLLVHTANRFVRNL